jgi:thiosulfate/3-mercaptopyruvate sulfurtransferase
MQALVDVKWVREHPEARLVDLRWSPKGPALERYRAGHLPGAAFVDLDRDLAQPGGPGRHPFPEVESFAALLARLGIAPETPVVVYDDGPGSIAARLWFMLRVHGHSEAAVLDGGLAAWTAAGLPLTCGEEPRLAPAALRTLSRDESRLVNRAEVAARPESALLLDARAPERFRGEVEPLDRIAGHIPGAVNAPFANNLGPDGRFKPAAELRDLYLKLGADRASGIIASCGSGVTACHDLLALELAGLPDAKLYIGSWSDWSSSGAPIATGP